MKYIFLYLLYTLSPWLLEGKILFPKRASSVMIGKIGKEFLHIHPVSGRRFPIFAQTHIEKAGLYMIWAQFKIDGKVHIADFTVDVTEGKKGENEEKSHAHHH